MRRAAKRDANHQDVGEHLRSRGWSVLDLASFPPAGCDFAVSKRMGVNTFAALLEVKDGSLPPSARQLTAGEQKVKDGWQGSYIIALSPEDAETKLNAAMVREGYCKMEDLR